MATATLERNALGHDKVARYGWRVTSDKGQFQEVLKSDLLVNNEVYQREATKAKVLALSANWSWISCGTLTVARRKGELWVVDGQHRKLAADNRSDITRLPCMIFDVENVSQEARAFLATNRNRKPMTALASFKAECAAGDEVALFVSDVIQNCGLRLTTASTEAGAFKAIALAKSLAATDRDLFVRAMQMGAKLALTARGPLHQKVLAGIFYVLQNVNSDDVTRLTKRLDQIGMAAIKRSIDSASAYYAKGGAKVYADGILQAVNKGLQHKFTMPAAMEGRVG